MQRLIAAAILVELCSSITSQGRNDRPQNMASSVTNSRDRLSWGWHIEIAIKKKKSAFVS